MIKLVNLLFEEQNEQNIPNFLKKLFSNFPRDARNWKYATDEIRDITNLVRQFYNEMEMDFTNNDMDDPNYIESLDYRSFKTPSVWNARSQDEIVRIYHLLSKNNKIKLLTKLKTNYPRWF